jgi:hypothetical protein
MGRRKQLAYPFDFPPFPLLNEQDKRVRAHRGKLNWMQ